jgi:hypothetical protein
LGGHHRTDARAGREEEVCYINMSVVISVGYLNTILIDERPLGNGKMNGICHGGPVFAHTFFESYRSYIGKFMRTATAILLARSAKEKTYAKACKR